MAAPRLMAISDASARREAGISDFYGWIEKLIDAGVDTVQIREKSEPVNRVLSRVQQAVERFGEHITILVNGRADLAFAARADGVHLPSDSVPLSELARRFGKHLSFGVSTHSISEIEQAHRQGAAYVTFSPIFATPSKAQYGPALGLEALTEASSLGIPVIALGGITPDSISRVVEAGASGVAAIRSFHDPKTLQAMTLRTMASAWRS